MTRTDGRCALIASAIPESRISTDAQKFAVAGIKLLDGGQYEEASAEFYGFYSVLSKFAAIWGPIIHKLKSKNTKQLSSQQQDH